MGSEGTLPFPLVRYSVFPPIAMSSVGGSLGSLGSLGFGVVVVARCSKVSLIYVSYPTFFC